MEQVVQQLLTELIKVAALVVGGFAVAALHKFRLKVGLQADAEQDAKVRAAVQNSILATEEGLRAEAKRLTGSAGDQKMADAVTKVMDKMPGLTVGEASTLVHEELPKVRALEAPAVFPVPVGTVATAPPTS
jgi:hypothetical protein